MKTFIKNKNKLVYLLPLFLLLFPVNQRLGLNGFPFEGKIEVLVLIVCSCLPFFANKLNFISQKQLRITLLFTFLFIVIQTFLNNYNFQACYSTESTPVSNFEMNFNTEENCQFSFDKPFNQDVTRTDYFLNFNSNPQNNQSIEYTNWDLYFLNQTGFNFYEKSFYGGSNDLNIPLHWVLKENQYTRISYNEYVEVKNNDELMDFDYGFKNSVLPIEPSRSWLSFGANWSSGNLNNYKDEIKISYVGEVKVTINGKELNLDPSYTEANSYVMQIPLGATVEFDYFYRFNGLINSIPNIPYASFTLTDLNDNFINIYESSSTRMLEVVSSIIFLIIFVIIFSSIFSNKKNAILYILLGSIAILLIEHLPPSYADIIELFLILSSIVFVVIKKEYKIRNFILPILIITLSSIKNLNLNSNVLYSLGGSDPLKYESWSQQIVYFMSLQGGEDIYLYQPGYRYLLSIFHLIFGDSHLSIVLFFRFIIVFLLFSIFLNLFEKHSDKIYFLSFNFILTYIFLSTYSSKLNLFSSLSEWPTWILGIAFIGIFIKTDFNFRNVYLMSFLLGACFFIRENQLPGLLYLAFLICFLAKDKKTILRILPLFAFFLLLPFLHNYFYGGKFVLEKNIFRSDVFYLSPVDLFTNFPEVYERFLFQLNYLIANPLNDGVRVMSGKIFPFAVILLILQWLFIYAKNDKKLINFLYFIIPLSFLGPHLFYQVHTYFPRHIIQGYLFMIASTMLINLKRNNSI